MFYSTPTSTAIDTDRLYHGSPIHEQICGTLADDSAAHKITENFFS